MHRFRQLLVGLAHQPSDDELIRYTARVVRLGTARSVHFVHVLDGSAVGADARQQVLEQARQRLAVHFDPGADVEVCCEVVEGSREDRLLSWALERRSDLIMVGHGQGHSGRKALARRLAMKAPCSVWMAPEGALPIVRRVLVPVDYSQPSADAFAVAAELARLQVGSELLTLHVYFNELFASFADYEAELRRREEGLLSAFDDRCAGLALPVRPLVAHSPNVAQAIVRTAADHDVDLVVMSTRGRSPSAAVLLGSVTEEVIMTTPRPLLAVKHYGAKLGLLQALLRASEQTPKPHYN